MKRLINTRFIDILTNNTLEQINSTEMKAIIEEFVDQVIATCNSETNYTSLFRVLNYTYIQLQTLQGEYTHQHKAKKKCVRLSGCH